MSDLRPKDVRELTEADLQTCGVWEFRLHEKAVAPNRGRVSPRPDVAVVRLTEGTGLFAVRSTFSLADGSHLIGYCCPIPREAKSGDHVLGYLAPAIVTDRGQVPLWHTTDGAPVEDRVAAYYAMLARTPDQLFPVTFRADVPIDKTVFAEGVVPAFCGLAFHGSRFTLFERR